MRVIARKGMAAATMQEIAEEAGVAKGTIYLYFRDRDELVEKTFETAITQLHDRLDAAIATEPTFAGKLRASIAEKIRFFSEHREFFRLYTSLRMPVGNAQQQRRQRRNCQPQYRARIDHMTALVEEAVTRGEIRTTNPQRMALFIIEASNAIVIDRVMEDMPPPEQDDVDMIADTILNGISTQNERSKH